MIGYVLRDSCHSDRVISHQLSHLISLLTQSTGLSLILSRFPQKAFFAVAVTEKPAERLSKCYQELKLCLLYRRRICLVKQICDAFDVFYLLNSFGISQLTG